MNESRSRGHWVAIVTGFISVAIGVIYLLLITVLDSRGQMLPPPPEAFGEVAIVENFSSGGVQLLS